ncbi:TPA: hypothetical protein ACH3X1_005773 [Trebouxia sp. C0004]
MRSSTSCPHGKVCGAGSEYDRGSVMPVLKVGLDEAKFGHEPVTFAQIMEAFLDSSTHPCSACHNLRKPVSSHLVTNSTLQVAPQVLILIFGHEQPEIQGVSGRSEVAVVLQEEFVLRYGLCGIHKQHYLVRQLMFHDGVGSSGGHFMVAVREQKDGRYKKGDRWRYLDSAHPVQSLSLDQLMYKGARDVYGAMLVAKTQPQDDPRPMLVAPPAPRALPFVPWDVQPLTSPGSPTYCPHAAEYTSDEWGCDGWQQAEPNGQFAVQPAALAPPPPRATSGHGQGNKGNSKKPSSSSSSACAEHQRQQITIRALAARAAQQQQAQADRQRALDCFTSSTASNSDKPAQSASVSKAQRREDKKTHQRSAHSSNQRVVESLSSNQVVSWPAYIVNARKTPATQPAVKTKSRSVIPKAVLDPKPVRPTPSPALNAGPKPLDNPPPRPSPSPTPMPSPAPTPTPKAISTAPPQSAPPPSPAPTPQAGLTPTAAPILKAGPVSEKVPAAKLKADATNKVKLATSLVKASSSPPPPPFSTLPASPSISVSLANPAPIAPPNKPTSLSHVLSSSPTPPPLSSSSNSSSSALPPPPPVPVKPSTTDLLLSPLTSSSPVSSMPASSNASISPLPAARKSPTNSGDQAGPGKKRVVMPVAIPVLAGACILGAGLLIGLHIVGKFSSVKSSMLTWTLTQQPEERWAEQAKPKNRDGLEQLAISLALMAIWTAPKAAQNATDIETPDIPESEGGKGRGRGGAKGARTGATSGRGRAKGRGRGSGSSRGPGEGRASSKLACNAAESATNADLPAHVHGADGFEEAEMNE